ncbi:DUF2955 domain-containing protein [Shewanella sp. GXUN23E]|uniref:DUF2955 domain-containing protein n=1 Tax=Shewanella sp. GXUN23E TaxID=3422498 RepID=UPI003D7EDEF8
MSRRPANALIRVAVFPVLLLFWQYVFGTDLPLLGPAMCAVFLTTTHEPPPLIMVILMGVVLFVTAWIQGALSVVLFDQPVVYYFALFGAFYWCMQRTHENPQDLLAILLIVSTAMIAVFFKQKGIDVSDIPWALLKNLLIAGFTAYLAYFLFPGGEPLSTFPKAAEARKRDIPALIILLKTGFIMLTLVVTINLNLAQSTIITVVVALILKDPDPIAGHIYGLRRLVVTYASVLYAVPPLLFSILQANIVATMGSAVICSLLMGCRAVERKASYNGIQLMYSSYVVLIFYGITTTGFSGISEDAVRFGSILGAVLFGMMVLLLLQPAERKTA